jgi:PHD/YefM family antitoxin component YafN of YafNO toxin-antitoxin module
MVDNQMFHIYEKGNNKPVKVCMTVEELEQMIAERQVDWLRWEVQPCYTSYEVGDASF